MPKDFAGRGSPTRSKPSKPKKRRKAVSPKARVLFHGPSFSSGAIVGGAIVILAAYAPEWLDAPIAEISADLTPVEQNPIVEFEFPTLLKDSEVLADPSVYKIPEAELQRRPNSYSIQAASFKSADDANHLRAQLLLQDLNAEVDSSLVNQQVWFRVTVGPFPRKVEADRAMTTLREMFLTPILLNNYN